VFGVAMKNEKGREDEETHIIEDAILKIG